MQTSNTALAALSAMLFLVGAGSASADGMRRNGANSSTSTTQSVVTFSGYDQARDSSYFFQGVQVALNGDIGRDGFMVRFYGSQVDYDYLNGTTPTHGMGRQGEFMIGYKASRGNIWGAAFVGVDHQNHKLTPNDHTNSVRGSETGLKVVGDLASLREVGPVYFALSGMYSTAFDSYWARARVGGNVNRVTIGPEFVALGNQGFDATRVGAFMTFDLKISPKLPLEVTLYAGHQFVAGSGNGGATGASGGEGEYFGLSLTSLF